MLHSNVTFACVSLNVNVAEFAPVGFAGSVRIVGAGGSESAVICTTCIA
jgi:hypothetical protein